MTLARVTIVTSGHPSTCPRMVKAADAAVEAGFEVRLVSVDYIDWATPLDHAVVKRRRWKWAPVALRRAERPVASRWVSARQRVAAGVATVMTPAAAPMAMVAQAYGRTHTELVEAVLAESFDFVYGGTVGALTAVSQAAREAKKPFALDFEDFHPAESEEVDAALTHALAARVVADASRGAAFTTAASGPIADAYTSQFDVAPFVVHNVVPRPTVFPHRKAAGLLRLYWFSQVVGPKRGLEDIVRAVAVAQVPAELHLRGAARPAYVDELNTLARTLRASLTIVVHPPDCPDAMVDLCGPHDIGLSLEHEGVLNRALCVPNKPLTYFAGGMAVIATDTVGQRTLRDAAGGGVWWYRPGDVEQLAKGLRLWHHDRAALAHAQQCCFDAAQQRFHWEHPLERGVLLDAFAQVLS